MAPVIMKSTGTALAGAGPAGWAILGGVVVMVGTGAVIIYVVSFYILIVAYYVDVESMLMVFKTDTEGV